MLSRILSGIMGGEPELPLPPREMKRPLPKTAPKAPDIVSLLGDSEKESLNDFVSHLVDFCYLPSKIKSTADPYSGEVLAIYCDARVANTEAEKSNKAVTPRIFGCSKSKHFGAYTLSMFIPLSVIRVLSSEKLLLESLVGKGDRMFCKKLMNVTEEMVAKYSHQYYVADIRYYLDLKGNPERIPEGMKNGKGNIFAGTIIMMGSIPHVLAASWVWDVKEKEFRFKEELVSLRNGLEDVAQFVLIKK